jgi:hypothetical protein
MVDLMVDDEPSCLQVLTMSEMLAYVVERRKIGNS